jgi:UDP-N-acetylmuramyl tripeptide synthase
MLASLGRAGGVRLVHNHAGSNLMRGLAATLVRSVSVTGTLPRGEETMAVLEVDEATLIHAARAVPPTTITFLNLFRDQLDRYGEVDAIFARWQHTVRESPAATTLVLNADDPTIAALNEGGIRSQLTFGVEDPSAAIEGQEHASDARWCHVCGTEYRYSALYAGHLGAWACEGCGRQRRPPDVSATNVTLHGFDRAEFTALTPGGTTHVRLELGGLYNVYNALAAIATGLAYSFPLDGMAAALAGFRPAFGRQERFTVDGKTARILLGKNPAGLNQVLRLLASLPDRKNLLVILNDGIADGTDVSWIWDADYELFAERLESAVVSGTRAAEMGVRLKYAGWGARWPVVSSIRDALDEALRRTPPGGELFVIPTYTAMLEVRELLARRSGARHYWEQAAR